MYLSGLLRNRLLGEKVFVSFEVNSLSGTTDTKSLGLEKHSLLRKIRCFSLLLGVRIVISVERVLVFLCDSCKCHEETFFVFIKVLEIKKLTVCQNC